MNIQNIKYPRAAIYYLILTIITLIVIFLVALNPVWQKKSQLESRIADLELKIEEQQLLLPVYAALTRELEDGPVLPEIASSDYEVTENQDVDSIISQLNNQARENNISNATFSPVPATLSRENNRLMININLESEYNSLKDFLAGLSSLPSFIRYDQIEFSSRPQSMKCMIQAWMAVN